MNLEYWLLLLGYATPVALAALGETVGQKSGVINIGLEGTMLVAAFVGLVVAYSTHSPWLGLGAGSLAGLAITLLFAGFTVFLGTDQVVVGTAINLMAMGLTSTLYRARFGQSGRTISVTRIPNWHYLDAVQVFLLLSVPAVWYLLQRTSWGLAVRAAGEYPKAAVAAGFSVERLRLSALALGGLLGGLGGAYLAIGVASSFAENMTAGRGFVAIAMVTFGRWRPAWVLAATLLIGFSESLQYRFQAMGVQVPFQLMIALPYLVALVVLVVMGKGSVAPMALGQTYRKER